MACEACLLNTPANFIAPFIAPPVILDVSVYLKSARAGTLNGASNRMDRATLIAFTVFPPRVARTNRIHRMCRCKNSGRRLLEGLRLGECSERRCLPGRCGDHTKRSDLGQFIVFGLRNWLRARHPCGSCKGGDFPPVHHHSPDCPIRELASLDSCMPDRH